MTDAWAWGIEEGYRDVDDRWHDAPEATIEALLAAMRIPPGADRPAEPIDPLVVRAGSSRALPWPCRLELEDGSELWVRGELPPDLPLGYHRVHPPDAEPARLVVTPARCHLPAGLRTWGWAVQLYAARSRQSWGIGDLADLRRLAQWSARLGAGALVVNPLHAAAPVVPQEPSPYFPTSRVFRNPLYLRVEEVPGASGLRDLERLAGAGRDLNRRGLIERDAVLPLKLEALEVLWSRFTGDERYDRFVAQADGLADFCVYCTVAERHGADWRKWPVRYRHPRERALVELATENADRIRFHSWLQWLLDEQLAAAAGAGVGLVQDLAIGFDPGGADAWAWQDLVAEGVRVGAPPDEFNTQGQDWGLPPFVPWRLRHAGYQPFITTMRSALRHAGGLRVDHVMGLFRLFWIPAGAGPAEGTYVRYPAADLLDLLALESHRAGAFVVGEDLGTVEPEVRQELQDRSVLSYRLLWFESEPPARYPEQALAAVTTHDLPTVAGLWTGADLTAQRSLGLEPNEESTAEIRARLQSWLGVEDDAPVGEVVEGAYRLLAQAPSAVLTAGLDDALGVEERPNMPGTTDEWPNWSIALPLPLEEIEEHPQVRAVAEALSFLRTSPAE